MRILDACALLWAWLRVRLLADADNLQGIDQQFINLPVTPQETSLIEKCYRNFKLVWTHTLIHAAPLPEPVPSEATPTPAVLSPLLWIRVAMHRQDPMVSQLVPLYAQIL